MNKFLSSSLFIIMIWVSIFPSVGSSTYYIAPNGHDSNSGTSPSSAWATFNYAWTKLYPGDTLYLLDGIYEQTLQPNVRNGEPGRPITVKALNDGKAVIDGNSTKETVVLGERDNPEVGNYFVIEGIVARNSSADVYKVTGNHNILRRISGYNANTDENKLVINIAYPSAQYNLVEDCVAAGSGRKMIGIWHASHNTIRRCFANWQSWDGRDSCQEWPWGENIDIYGASNNIVENSIGYGSVPYFSFTIRTNEVGYDALNNQILGSIAVYAGMNKDGTPVTWPATRPQPTQCTNLRDWTQRGQRAGFASYSSDGKSQGNIWRDILAWGNAGHGFSAVGNVNPTNSAIDHATLYHNGLDNGYAGNTRDGSVGTNVIFSRQLSALKITNSFIAGTSYTGSGARLQYRYVDGILMDATNGERAQPLWPWPMEDRIKRELGISVTDEIYFKLISQLSMHPVHPMR